MASSSSVMNMQQPETQYAQQSAPAAPVSTMGDIEGMLKKIAELEQEKANLAQSLQQTTGKVEKLTEKTKQEMQEKLNTIISEWMKTMTTAPQEKKDEFMKGLERLVNHTADDSGVWQVVCCASEAHAQNVTALENARKENEELKQRLNGGQFAHPSARMEYDNGKKRKADVISEPVQNPASFKWDDFAVMLAKDHESNGYSFHEMPKHVAP
jgi:vacuolar-type H+-ATPase subunit I/STV1